MKYKKYIVFLFDSYYPGGGTSDIAGSFDTFAEAEAFVLKQCADNSEIIDRDTWEQVPITSIHTNP